MNVSLGSGHPRGDNGAGYVSRLRLLHHAHSTIQWTDPGAWTRHCHQMGIEGDRDRVAVGDREREGGGGGDRRRGGERVTVRACEVAWLQMTHDWVRNGGTERIGVTYNSDRNSPHEGRVVLSANTSAHAAGD